MVRRLDEHNTSNRRSIKEARSNKLSRDEYEYWFNIGLDAFERGDKCIPAHSPEYRKYLRDNPNIVGSEESKKSVAICKAWLDGWTKGNLDMPFESVCHTNKKSIKEATKMSSLESLCEQINKKMPPREGEYFIENIGYGSGKYRLSVLYPENGGVSPVSPAMTKRELEEALQTVVAVYYNSNR